MRLGTLIEGLDFHVSQPTHGVGADLDVEITDVVDDSRRVSPGALFIARHDATGEDGRRFVIDAVEQGAVAVIASNQPIECLPSPCVWLQAPTVDQPLVGELAERFWHHPSRQLQLIGITGTNGKTTTAFLTQHLLQKVGVKCGMIGTVFIDDGADRTTAELTTPGAADFSRLLARMVANGCTAVVAEVSSHALHQGRVSALQFTTGVFTNLTGDHLDYHGTMDDYAAAKARLFETLPTTGFAVVNHNDAFADRMVRDCKANVLRCSVCDQPGGHDIECTAEVIDIAAAGSRVRLDGAWGSVEVTIPLIGRHNIANLLQALSAASTIASLTRGLRASLEQCPSVPGRLEPVSLDADASQPTVLVDYAHTHDALDNVLVALKPLTRGRLITVFGCGGDRDGTKRPKMAAAACKFSDVIIITSDNPRGEDPDKIIAEVRKGVPTERMNDVMIEPDRAIAIRRAIEQAAPDDVVLIAGKGHEDYQIVGSETLHFDDRERALQVLRERLGAAASHG